MGPGRRHGPAYSVTDTNRNSYTHSYTNPYANAFVDSYGNSDFEPHFHAQSHPNAKIGADARTASHSATPISIIATLLQ